MEQTTITITRNFDFNNLENNQNIIEEISNLDFTSFKNKNASLNLILMDKENDKESIFKIGIDQLIQLGNKITIQSYINLIK